MVRSMDTRRRQETKADGRTRQEIIRRSQQTRRQQKTEKPRDVSQSEMAREEIRRDTRREMTRLIEIKEEGIFKTKINHEMRLATRQEILDETRK